MDEEKSLEELNRAKLEKLKAAEQKNQDQELADAEQQLSVRDRLMLRLTLKTVKTVFEDDLGEFEVETRLMTVAERAKAVQYNQLLSRSAEDAENYGKAIQGFKELLRELLITDLGDYLDSDAVMDDVVIALAMGTLRATMASVGEAIGSFRQE